MTNTQFKELMAELRGIRGAVESLDAAVPTLERRGDGGVGVSDAQPDGRSPNAPPTYVPSVNAASRAARKAKRGGRS